MATTTNHEVTEALRKWLDRPSGSFAIAPGFHVEAVEGGGLMWRFKGGEERVLYLEGELAKARREMFSAQAQVELIEEEAPPAMLQRMIALTFMDQLFPGAHVGPERKVTLATWLLTGEAPE